MNNTAPAESNPPSVALPAIAAAVTATPLQKQAVLAAVQFAKKNPWKTAALVGAAAVALAFWGKRNQVQA